MGFKESLQLDIGKFAGLGQSIHALSYFNIDMPLVDQGMEIVVFNDVRWQDGHQDAHVHIVLSQHGGAQVTKFDGGCACNWH